MPRNAQQKRRRIVGAVLAVMTIWTLVANSFTGNLWFAVPAITIMAAWIMCPRPAVIAGLTVGLHLTNIGLFAVAGMWDVVRYRGVTAVGTAVIANAALTGLISRAKPRFQAEVGAWLRGRGGLAFQVAGGALAGAGFLLWWALSLEPPSHDAGMLYLGGMATVVAGGYAFYRGKQYRAVAMREELERDPRPRVLYLRSFRRDERPWQAALSFLLRPWLLPRGRGEEEQLAHALAPIGPLVAIGTPSEELPPPGAGRTYVSDAEWKSTVETMMREAALVLIRVDGHSDGLWWEITRAAEVVPPDRLLLLLLLGRKNHHGILKALREKTSIDCAAIAAGVQGFLWTRDGGHTELLGLSSPFWRTPAFKPLRAQARYALRPVFECMGVPWPEPRIALTRLAVVVPGLVALAFAFALVISNLA